jgi:PAS domain S-box-containing protein
MPGMGGFETAQLIRTWPRSKATPILFVTAAENVDISVEEAYAMGGVDFLVKPLVPAVIRAKVAVFIELYRSRQEVMAVRQLQHSQDRLRLATTVAGLGLWTLAASGRELIWENDKPNEILGIPPSVATLTLERMMSDLLLGDDAERFRMALDQSLGSGGDFHCEVRVLRQSDGELRWLEFTGRPQSTNSARMIGTVADITARTRARHELQELAVRLSAADRRKNDFLATLAHELRNPLAALTNGLRLLRVAGGAADASHIKTLDMMQRQLGLIVRLTDDLLDVARIGHGKLELKKSPVSVRDVIAAALETAHLRPEGRQHDLRVQQPGEALVIDADPARLIQVVSNLLSNACKYTPPGGRIELSACRDGPDAVITLADDGIGIPPSALPHVFELYAQADDHIERAQGGLGIGLSLVRHLVQMHGGTVTARSAGPGQGSTFVVRLRLVPRSSVRRTCLDGVRPGHPRRTRGR